MSASIRTSERVDGPRFKRKVDELQAIPGIGPSLAENLRSLGVKRVADLKGRDPQRLYDKLNQLTGVRQDPCVLYTFRCAVYYASHKRHDPEKLKWWNWKDEKG